MDYITAVLHFDFNAIAAVLHLVVALGDGLIALLMLMWMRQLGEGYRAATYTLVAMFVFAAVERSFLFYERMTGTVESELTAVFLLGIAFRTALMLSAAVLAAMIVWLMFKQQNRVEAQGRRIEDALEAARERDEVIATERKLDRPAEAGDRDKTDPHRKATERRMDAQHDAMQEDQETRAEERRADRQERKEERRADREERREEREGEDANGRDHRG